MFTTNALRLALGSIFLIGVCEGLAQRCDRREAMAWIGGAVAGYSSIPRAEAAVDAEDFLKTGMVAQPMGVSGGVWA